jgi:hypothetical protein
VRHCVGMHLPWRRLAGLAKRLPAGALSGHAHVSKETATHSLCHMCGCVCRRLGVVGAIWRAEIEAQVSPLVHTCGADAATVPVVVVMVEPERVHVDVTPNYTAVEPGSAVEPGRCVAGR